MNASDKSLIDTKRSRRTIGLSLLAAMALVPGNARAADVEAVLHTFPEPTGRNPVGPLLMDANGALYGGAAASGGGVIYKLAPPPTGTNKWTYTNGPKC